MQPVIEFQEVTFYYAPAEAQRQEETQLAPDKALQEVALSIPEGQFTAVIGHNGSGKSTLAKHINALLLPQEGLVMTCGMDTRDGERLWEIRQQAGMVFQNPDNQLVAGIVEEDVAFGPENLGVERSEIRRRVDEALAEVRMDGFAQREPHMLSGGQKQRVAIAGVIAMRPRVIVMDEPTAMLDPLGRKEVMQTALQLAREEHITVVLITHFMEEALQADHVIVMDGGRIHVQGPPREVFTQVEELQAIGLDVPAMTDLARRLRQDGVDIPADIMTVEEMVDALWPLLQADCPIPICRAPLSRLSPLTGWTLPSRTARWSA